LYNKDLSDLSQSNDQEKQDVVELIWAIKKLFSKLNQLGHQEWSNLFENLCQCKLNNRVKTELSQSLSQATLSQYIDAIFPNLKQEIIDYQEGVLIPYSADNQELNNENFNTEPSDSSDIKNNTDNIFEEVIVDLSDIILELPNQAIEFKTAKSEPTLISKDKTKRENQPKSDNQKIKTIIEPASAEEWVKNGGWYIEHGDLYYRPSGHADKVLKSLYDFSFSQQTKNNKTPSLYTSLSKDILKPTSPGQCLKCHRLNKNGENTAENPIHWASYQAKQSKDFTYFTHLPHLMTKKEKLSENEKWKNETCFNCHQFIKDDAILNQIISTVETKAEKSKKTLTEFLPIKKSQCSACHNPKKIGENCLNCHNYHIVPNQTVP